MSSFFSCFPLSFFFFFFFFNDTATTEIYTLSLHDALPISFCAVWAAAATIHDVVAAWRDGVVLSWARFQLFEAFACMAVIAAVMGLPIVAVRNLGPASGWRRAAALAAAIAAMAPFGAAVRLG